MTRWVWYDRTTQRPRRKGDAVKYVDPKNLCTATDMFFVRDPRYCTRGASVTPPMAYKAPPPLSDWLARLPGLPGDLPRLDGLPERDVEAEMVGLPHLMGDITYAEDGTIDHRVKDARQEQGALEHVGRFPAATDGLHLIASGKYALWDLAKALVKLASPATIDSIYLATLGFSRVNVSEMVEMIDAGSIARLSLLCSHYFAGTSNGIWDYAAEEFAKRPAARFLSIRTHCKIIAMRLTDGRTVTLESSANLRSCKNIEQVSIFGHPGLYEFHAGWLEELFTRGKQ